MKVYMKVSKDKYELPEAVADSWNELALLCGITLNAIYKTRSRTKALNDKGLNKVMIYQEVEIGNL